MKLTSEQVARRAALLRNKNVEDLGGTQQFRGLDAERLETLVREGLADVNDKHNDAPTLDEFLTLLKREPRLRAHGYSVSSARDDCRVSIEGIHVMAGNFGVRERARIREVFATFARSADELRLPECGNFYAWWD